MLKIIIVRRKRLRCKHPHRQTDRQTYTHRSTRQTLELYERFSAPRIAADNSRRQRTNAKTT